MQAILKLTAVALSAAGIIGGAALAQTTLDPARTDNPSTANYSITPGSNLKRDSSLSAPRTAPVVAAPMDTSSTTTSTVTTTEVTPAAPAPMAEAAPAPAPEPAAVDTMPPARADRN